MDPNDPGQTPGGDTPPVWGPPPAPDQPGYGAPPPPLPAPYGAPPAPFGAPPAPYGAPPAPYGAPPAPYGAPPAPYGAPPAPYGAPPAPYGAPPAWGAPPPAAKSSIGKRILIGVGVVIIALVVLGVIGYVLTPKHAGQVIFTTDAPTASGAATCQLGNQVTTVSAGTPVYANYFYTSKLTGETVTVTVIKDGSVLDSSTLSADESNGIDCVESSANLGDLPPGVYEWKLTDSKGNTVSDGKLTIK